MWFPIAILIAAQLVCGQLTVTPGAPTNFGTNTLYALGVGATDPNTGTSCANQIVAYAGDGASDETIALGGLLTVNGTGVNVFGTFITGGLPGNLTVQVRIAAMSQTALVNTIIPSMVVQTSYQAYPPGSDVCDTGVAIQHNCTLTNGEVYSLR